MKKIAIYLIFLSAMFLAGCFSNSHPQNSWKESQESFVKVSTVLSMKQKFDTKSSFETRELESGSGFGIGNNEEGSFILTAGHVCQIVYSFQNSETPKFDELVFDISLVITNNQLNTFPAKIIKINAEEDLCLVFVPSVRFEPIQISNNDPIAGDVVIHIGAPFGVLIKESPLLFQGIYSGYSTEIKKDIYNLSVEFGCSGGPILNKNGKLIGIVFAKDTRLSNISYSMRRERIQEFVIGGL